MTEKGVILMNRENLERNKFDEGRERERKKNVNITERKENVNVTKTAGFRYNKYCKIDIMQKMMT